MENLVYVTQADFEWDPAPARKRIYRSVQNGVWVEGTEEVIGTLNGDNEFSDPDVPASGEFFYYEIRTFNNCGEGF